MKRALRVPAALALLALACGESSGGVDRLRSGEGAELAARAETAADADAPADPSPIDAGSTATEAPDSTAPSDASGCDGAGCECPSPRTGCSGGGPATWSRDPATGVCCQYEAGCGQPEGWSVFASQEECSSSCRCRDVTPNDFSQVETLGVAVFGHERTSLECFCQGVECPATFADAVAGSCEADNGAGLSLLVGCGKIAVAFSGGYVGSTQVFDATSGALIGIQSFSDVPTRPCFVYGITAGAEFDCAEAVECPLCDSGTARASCD